MGAGSSRCESDQISISKNESNIEVPHSYESIEKDFDSQVDTSTVSRLYEQLHAGVFLNHKRKKYWVDKAKNNCFIIYARELSITWSADGRYWQWLSEKDTTSQELIDVAKLENVCWLEVLGKFDVSKLSNGVLYEVAFIVKMTDSGYGWEVPVNTRLVLPDGSKQELKVNLLERPKGYWIHVPVGEFRASPKITGEAEFSMYEYEGGKWKRGLIIMGVVIQPKNVKRPLSLFARSERGKGSWCLQDLMRGDIPSSVS